jgi:hypothetical protein
MDVGVVTWDRLPVEVADQIGTELAKRFLEPFNRVDAEVIRCLCGFRRLCTSFAKPLRRYALFFTHITRPEHPTHLVEGLLRELFAVENMIAFPRSNKGHAIFNYGYCTVYTGCFKTRPRLDQAYHEALRAVLIRMLREREIAWTENGADNPRFRVVAYVFKVLDRFYIRRLYLSPIAEVLRQAYLDGKPD